MTCPRVQSVASCRARAKAKINKLATSGDTSCADHDISWRVRHALNLDFLTGGGGVSGDPAHPDNIIYDITPNPNGGTGNSAGGCGHPLVAVRSRLGMPKAPAPDLGCAVADLPVPPALCKTARDEQSPA